MAKLLYQGHGSFRLVTDGGVVVYLDPYAGEGYDIPADIILVTHQHEDHNQIQLITQKPGCVLITNVEALAGGKRNTFTEKGIQIETMEASNQNHTSDECVGFLLSFDGLQLYFSGDTSQTAQMSELAARKLDFAFFCGDGFYNMSLEEAAKCAEIVGAKHNVPVHLKPGELFDKTLAEQFKAPNRLILEPGKEIQLN